MKQFITLIILLSLFCACKTHKVATQTSTVSTSSSVAVNKAIYDSLSTKSIDTSKSTTSSVTEAKTTSSKDATLEVDSIVQTKSNGAVKIVIYPTKGKPIHYQSLNTDNSTSKTDVADKKGIYIEKTGVGTLTLDSVATINRDSTGKTKATEAIGSGTTYAKWIGIAILVFAVLMAIVIYLRTKKPKV